MEVGSQYDFVLPSRQSLGVGSLIPLDFIPEPWTSSRVSYAPLYGVFQTLLSDNSGPFQHRDAEASEILFSGFYMPLVVIPLDFFPDTLDFLTVFTRSARGVFQTLYGP